jgi:hypothetical protein
MRDPTRPKPTMTARRARRRRRGRSRGRGRRLGHEALEHEEGERVEHDRQDGGAEDQVAGLLRQESEADAEFRRG